MIKCPWCPTAFIPTPADDGTVVYGVVTGESKKGQTRVVTCPTCHNNVIIPENYIEEKNKIVDGLKPKTSDPTWLTYCPEWIKNSSKTLDDAAKNLVTLNTTLITVYAAALAYFGNLTKMSSDPFFYVLIVPFIPFFISIWFNLEVYSPRGKKIRCDQPETIKAAFNELNQKKDDNFQKGKICFVIALIFVIGCLVQAGNATTEKYGNNVQLVVKNENIPLIQNMSISFTPNSTVTTPLVLTKQLDKMYRVKISNGNEIEISKDLIVGIVYLQ
jgi:hypothetical protein